MREKNTQSILVVNFTHFHSRSILEVLLWRFSLIISLYNLFFASIFELQVLAGSDYHASWWRVMMMVSYSQSNITTFECVFCVEILLSAVRFSTLFLYLKHNQIPSLHGNGYYAWGNSGVHPFHFMFVWITGKSWWFSVVSHDLLHKPVWISLTVLDVVYIFHVSSVHVLIFARIMIFCKDLVYC